MTYGLVVYGETDPVAGWGSGVGGPRVLAARGFQVLQNPSNHPILGDEGEDRLMRSSLSSPCFFSILKILWRNKSSAW